nr:aminodeoxychorismate lyase [Thiocystis violacea]
MIDGQSEDSVSVLDRGFHYGDGLFETLRLSDGRPCQWQRHLDRLALGTERLGIPMPSARVLADEARSAAQGLDAGILKLILSRGPGGRGYRPPDAPAPTRLLLTYALAEGVEDPLHGPGVVVRYCHTPVSVNPVLAGIKHLNRLDSVLARQEWADDGIAEGLMQDPSGAVIGGTMTNLFLWDGMRLLTPSLDRSGIAGTIRGLTLELAARMGMNCLVTRLEPVDLDHAAGLFLTNAVIGVWPVRTLAGRDFHRGDLPWNLLRAVHQAARTPG